MALTPQQLRYPFSNEARDALFRIARDIRVLIDELERPRNNEIVRQAEERVYAALMQEELKLPDPSIPESILVYQAARLIVEKIGEPRLKEYQAEAESKAVNKYLASESDRFAIDLSQTAFGWAVESTGSQTQRAKLPIMLRS
ncbi:MAG: hypothetical protein ACFFAY_12820, partial [Promethearchaeota archaeon]